MKEYRLRVKEKIMKADLATIRREYTKGGLKRSDLPDNPLVLDGKFIFYTNYGSRKGKHLAHNPSISISFVWHELERQIHIEGIAAKVSPQESDEYFRKRPYKSRIGARISPQSEPIESRIQLIRDFVKETTRWIGKEIDRPEYWGGFAVMPVRVEFWQGRVNRLHDRFLYMLQSDGVWKIERLAP